MLLVQRAEGLYDTCNSKLTTVQVSRSFWLCRKRAARCSKARCCSENAKRTVHEACAQTVALNTVSPSFNRRQPLCLLLLCIAHLLLLVPVRTSQRRLASLHSAAASIAAAVAALALQLLLLLHRCSSGYLLPPRELHLASLLPCPKHDWQASICCSVIMYCVLLKSLSLTL